jgi:SAM-dependent methyltransferase
VRSPAQQLEQEYAMRFEQCASYRIKVWEVLTHEFFSAWIPATSTVLDLGCGWGEFINQIVAQKKYGMDLNPASPGKLSRDVTFLGQDCSEPWQLPDSHLDVVFTSNFFEHLPSKETLQRTLAEAFRCLKPNGRLICLGPNVKFLPGEYWDFWDHFLPLTELSLQEGLELTGFSVERKWARFLPYSMSQGFTPPLVFLRLYLRLRFIWPILGKQFLVLARRPAG